MVIVILVDRQSVYSFINFNLLYSGETCNFNFSYTVREIRDIKHDFSYIITLIINLSSQLYFSLKVPPHQYLYFYDYW